MASILDATSPFELFNRKLEDFVDDLHPVIGHLPEYKLVSSGIKWLSQYDAQKNQQLFDKYVLEYYENRIMQRDEAFFLSSDNYGYQDMNLVQLLKSVWATSLTPNDKNAVWGHMQVLTVLSRRCREAQGCSTNVSS